MSSNMRSEALLSHEECPASNPLEPIEPVKHIAKPSRRALNDLKWDSVKEEIYRIYMTNDFTLQNTKRTIEEEHGFVASERKWKDKLKEWSFDKNISASDMTIILSKAEKRSRDEGKETVFFHGETQITKERMEQFKRRKTTGGDIATSTLADTPKNITYHTPRPDSPEPLLQQAGEISSFTSRNEFLAPFIDQNFPGATISTLRSEARGGGRRLSAVLKLTEEPGLSGNESSTAATINASSSNKTDEHGSRLNQPWPQMDGMFDCGWEETIENEELPPERPFMTEPGRPSNTELILPNIQHLTHRLDALLVDRSTNITLESSASVEIASPSNAMTMALCTNTPQGLLRNDVQHSFLATSSMPTENCFYDNRCPGLKTGRCTDSRNQGEDCSASSTATPVSGVAVGLMSLQPLDGPSELQLLAGGGQGSDLEPDVVVELEEEYFLKSDRLTIFDPCNKTYTLDSESSVVRKFLSLMGKARERANMGNEDLEATYRETIAGWKILGYTHLQLEYEIMLGGLLHDLDRNSEALHLLVGALSNHYELIETPEREKAMAALIDSIKRIHVKMGLNGNLADIATGISCLQRIRACHRVHLSFWTELTNLGGYYSTAEKFEIADLCFRHSSPIRTPKWLPLIMLQQILLYWELSLHYKRQRLLVTSINYLTDAFGQILMTLPSSIYLSTIWTEELRSEIRKLVAYMFEELETLLLEADPLDLSPVDSTDFDIVELLAALQKAKHARARAASLLQAFQPIPAESGAQATQNRSYSISGSSSSCLSSGQASSRFGVTYSVGSASSFVSNSAFMVP